MSKIDTAPNNKHAATGNLTFPNMPLRNFLRLTGATLLSFTPANLGALCARAAELNPRDSTTLSSYGVIAPVVDYLSSLRGQRPHLRGKNFLPNRIQRTLIAENLTGEDWANIIKLSHQARSPDEIGKCTFRLLSCLATQPNMRQQGIAPAFFELSENLARRFKNFANPGGLLGYDLMTTVAVGGRVPGEIVDDHIIAIESEEAISPLVDDILEYYGYGKNDLMLRVGGGIQQLNEGQFKMSPISGACHVVGIASVMMQSARLNPNTRGEIGAILDQASGQIIDTIAAVSGWTVARGWVDRINKTLH